jgi:hypothetical protein
MLIYSDKLGEGVMRWSRHLSITEELMVSVLKKQRKPLRLPEIVDEIRRLNPSVLDGKSPRNSLYSIVYRRERRRVERGEKALFLITQERNEVYYSLNK